MSEKLIDEHAVDVAVTKTLHRQETGERFLKEFGIRQIVEDYENAKQLRLVQITLSEEAAEDVLGEHLVILRNGHVHVTNTVRSLAKAVFKLVKE